MFNGIPNQRGRFWFVISFAPRFTHFSPLWHFTQAESHMDLSEIWGHSKIKYEYSIYIYYLNGHVEISYISTLTNCHRDTSNDLVI